MKKFAAFRITHFKRPQKKEYGYAFVDDLNQLAVLYPGTDVFFDVELLGDADNEFDFEELKEYCKLHHVEFNEEFDKSPYCPDDDVISMLNASSTEAVMAATEAPFKPITALKNGAAALKQKSREGQITKSMNSLGNLEPKYQQNLKVLKEAIATQRPIEAAMTPQEIARYAVSKESGSIFIYVQHSTNVRQVLHADVARSEDTTDDKATVTAAATTLANINAQVNALKAKKPIVIGYTLTEEEDGIDKNGFESTLSTRDYEQLAQTPQGLAELNKIFGTLSKDSDKYNIIRAVFKDNITNLPSYAITYLRSQKSPFSSVGYKVLRQQLAAYPGAKIQEKAFKSVMTSNAIQKAIGADVPGSELKMHGLDLSDDRQATLLLYVSQKYYYIDLASFKNEDGSWMPAEQMAEVFKQKLREEDGGHSSDSSSTGGSSTRSRSSRRSRAVTRDDFTNEEARKAFDLFAANSSSLRDSELSALSRWVAQELSRRTGGSRS